MKLPPHNLQAEQCVLGAVMIDGRVMDDIAEILRPHHFYRASHSALYAAMLAIWDAGQRITPPAVVEALQRAGSRVEDPEETLDDLARLTPHAANARHDAGIVREKAMVRDLIDACQAITTAAYAQQLSADELIREATEAIAQVSDAATPAELSDTVTLMGESVDLLRKADMGEILGIDCGLEKLRAATGLWAPGDLIIGAARPGMGKTAFAIVVGHHVARAGGRVLFFSLEMTKREIGDRLLVSESRVNGAKVRDPLNHRLTDADWEAIGRAPATIRHGDRFQIDDRPARSLVQMAAIARREKARRGLDLVMVDYVQLIKSCREDRRRDQSRQEEVAGIARDLKNMARALECPVLALAQLNRLVEARADNIPRLSDLRESGAIEQDADKVLLIHREAYYDETPSNRYAATVIVAKNRNGPTGHVELAWVPELSWFAERERINEYTEAAF